MLQEKQGSHLIVFFGAQLSSAIDFSSSDTRGAQVELGGRRTYLYVSLLGVKGDWPALTKLGGLTRHHGREAHKTESAGICHLCRAGQPGFNFHKFDFTSMQAARTGEMPWLRPSSLSRKVPQSPSKREQFYKIDTFHVGHEGVMGDLCANAIATCQLQTENKFCIFV